MEYLQRFGKPLAFYSDKASFFRINQPGAVTGPGYTQFGRALYELNIDGICANTAAAKGRVERAHLTLQDRLVKELRLEGISSIEAANAFMPRFINDYNKRFAKEPLNSHNAHRAVRVDENLDSIFSWRELRKVTKALTLHYERKLYMLADTAINRSLIGKYLEFFQYPDGRIEIRAGGVSLPYSTYDKLGAVDQGQTIAWIEGDSLRRFREELVRERRNLPASPPREPFVWETHNTVFALIGLLAGLYFFGIYLHETLTNTLWMSFIGALLAARFARLIMVLAFLYTFFAVWAAFHKA